jgi:uncharacterized protein (DUF934 family)
MPRLIRNRTLVDDRYTLLRAAASLADLPDGAPVIVPLALWAARRAALIARSEAGVWLASSDHPAALADDVHRLPVIAIDFPQFTDGRGYSHARMLRERYRYAGELRAIGDIQRDQLYYLAQCGFDAFVIPDARDAEDALRGLADFSDGYQATAVRAPWFKRRRGDESPGDVRIPCA